MQDNPPQRPSYFTEIGQDYPLINLTTNTAHTAISDLSEMQKCWLWTAIPMRQKYLLMLIRRTAIKTATRLK